MGWFLEWRRLYTRDPQSPATDEDIQHLTDSDSVNGWTSSNVLKRLSLTDVQQERVRELLHNNKDAVVRWRAGHVLGAFANRANLDVLLAGLCDATASVRLGCARSLIEMAARDRGLTTEVFRGLTAHADEIAEHRSVVEEIQRAVFVRLDVAPPNWTGAVLPVFAVLQAKSPSAYAAEQWDRVLKELVTSYGL
jgi:hypothetical protein